MEHNTEHIGKVRLNYDYYSGEDLYVDGSEEKLLNIVKSHSHKEYNSVIQQHKEWPILYHLSDVRGNIINWIPFSKEQKVLEIGAGCGAITQALAPLVGRVDCIELSKARSYVNAYRNKDKDNVNIYVGNFQDIETSISEKYDYITLIGVLEYAPSYIQGDKPFLTFINTIKKHLKPSGKLIIAIENKFGLKYWAGCKEDHVGEYFAGIEGYTNSQNVMTFSKNGLNKLLYESGAKDISFYYPYPDYKLPLVIYSDDYLPKKGTLNNNFRNFDYERMVIFDEAKVYDSLIEDGMFDIFSNSFLVLAGYGE